MLDQREVPMPTERVDFLNSRGQSLAALLELPDREPVAYALFAHCFPCGKDNLAAKRIAETLAQRGIAVLRFDFTGLGMSEGEFANTDFSSNVADLVAAADHLRKTRRPPALPIGPHPSAQHTAAALVAARPPPGRPRRAAPRRPGARGGRGRHHRGALRSRSRDRPVQG